MIAFGGLAGLEESIEEDHNLKVWCLGVWDLNVKGWAGAILWLLSCLENSNKLYRSEQFYDLGSVCLTTCSSLFN